VHNNAHPLYFFKFIWEDLIVALKLENCAGWSLMTGEMAKVLRLGEGGKEEEFWEWMT
jgi:hypothetical protein